MISSVHAPGDLHTLFIRETDNMIYDNQNMTLIPVKDNSKVFFEFIILVKSWDLVKVHRGIKKPEIVDIWPKIM